MPVLGPQTYGASEPRISTTSRDGDARVARSGAPRRRIEVEPAEGHGHRRLRRHVGVDAGDGDVERACSRYDRRTAADYNLTVRTADGIGSGWASKSFKRAAPARRRRARATARSTRPCGRRSRRRFEPGNYTVVLEPAALAEHARVPGVRAPMPRQADEGRRFFSKQGGGNRIGEQLLGESVTHLLAIRRIRRRRRVRVRRRRPADRRATLGREGRLAGAGLLALLGAEAEPGADRGARRT